LSKKRFVSLLVRLRELRPDIVDPESLIREGRILVEGFPVTNAHPVYREEVAHYQRAGPPQGRAKTPYSPSDVLRGREREQCPRCGEHRPAASRKPCSRPAHGRSTPSYRSWADPWFSSSGPTGRGPRAHERRWPDACDRSRHRARDHLGPVIYLSIAHAVPQLNVLDIAPSAVLVALVKPMFELGLRELPGAGLWPEAVARASEGVNASGSQVQSVVRSPIIGGRGAVEFLLHASRQ
jgi:hypothetical protein